MALAPTSRLHWAGTHDQALDYAAGTVVLQGGALYRARLLRLHGAAAPADDAEHWDTLVAAPALRGPHDRSGAYAPRDVVTDAGGLYTCTAPVAAADTRVDTFERPDQEGWGTASDGHVWDDTLAFNPGIVFSVADSGGHLTASNVDGSPNSDLWRLGPGLGRADADVLVRWTYQGSNAALASVLLYAQSDEEGNDAAFTQVYVNGTVDLSGENSDTMEASWAGASLATPYWTRFRITGSDLAVRTWAADGETPEPTSWDLEHHNTQSTPEGRRVGLQAYNLAVDDVVTFDHFSATTLAPAPAADPDHWMALAVDSVATGAVQTTAPAAGDGDALPATPAGYLQVTIAGAPALLPYYRPAP